MHARPLYRDVRTVNVGTTDTQLLGPGPRRVGLIISAPPTNRITLSFGDTAAVLDQGITIYPGTLPLSIYDELLARAFREGVRCISAAAAQNVTVIDVLADL